MLLEIIRLLGWDRLWNKNCFSKISEEFYCVMCWLDSDVDVVFSSTADNITLTSRPSYVCSDWAFLIDNYTAACMVRKLERLLEEEGEREERGRGGGGEKGQTEREREREFEVLKCLWKTSCVWKPHMSRGSFNCEFAFPFYRIIPYIECYNKKKL